MVVGMGAVTVVEIVAGIKTAVDGGSAGKAFSAPSRRARQQSAAGLVCKSATVA